MSIASVATRGYGTWGSVNLVPTLGYGIGAAAPSVATYAITRRGTLIGQSSERLILSGQSSERRSIYGQSDERRTLTGYDA